MNTFSKKNFRVAVHKVTKSKWTCHKTWEISVQNGSFKMSAQKGGVRIGQIEKSHLDFKY